MKNGIITMIHAFENISIDSIPPSPATKRSRPNSLKRKGTFESDDSNKRLATGLSMYFSESLQLESPIASYDVLETLNNRAEQILDRLRSSSIPEISEIRPWLDAQLLFYQRDLHQNSSLWTLTCIDKSHLGPLVNKLKTELWAFTINLLHQVNDKCNDYTWNQMESDEDMVDHILLLYQCLTDLVELLGINIPHHFVDSLLPSGIFFSQYSTKCLNHLLAKRVVSDVRILQLIQNFTQLLEEMHLIWNGNHIFSQQLEANCTEFGLRVCAHIGSLKDSDLKNISRINLLLSTIARYIKAFSSLGDISEGDLTIIVKFIQSIES